MNFVLALVGLFALIVAVAVWLHGWMEAEMQQVLGVMAEGEQMGVREWTGNQLARAMSWSEFRSGPFASLHQLERLGLVESREEPDSGTPERGGIPRRLYWITSRGRYVQRSG